MEVLFLSEADVRRLLDPDQLLDALADELAALTLGESCAPARNEVTVPEAGFLLGMPAWRLGLPISVKLVSVFHGNARLGIPGHQAVISLFDPDTGTLLAIMDGTYITAMRTAGGAAVSARLLSRQNARVLAIIGAGVQGQAHLELFPRVRDFEDIRVGSLYFEDAQRIAVTNPRARAVESFEEAVRDADVVCLCTTSSNPVVKPEWLKPGVHVTSVGYMPPGGELDPAIISRSHLFVETRQAFEPTPVGCDELQGLDPSESTELGEVLLARRPGRQSDAEVSVYKSMGHAVEDMAAAALVYRRAKEEGAGQIVRM